jgi:hypothetical protein
MMRASGPLARESSCSLGRSCGSRAPHRGRLVSSSPSEQPASFEKGAERRDRGSET